ncbi:hypothetical protein F5Y13DRAFT_193762 [Hypoxylon sp. FL1857]|nr:hypothetical protein F5Y13DRAFT_193762 [Hypoxylon sp. FL1857]
MALCVLSVLFVKLGGSGRHAAYWQLHDEEVLVTYLKIQTATEFVYMAGVTFPKVCILMLYLDIFVERKVRIMTKIVLGIVLANYFANGLIAPFTTCQPLAFKWDKTIPGGHCANLGAAYRYVSLPNIVTDLAILALPSTTLYRLQICRMRKIGIFLTFMAGGLGIIAAIARFVEFYTVDFESDPTYLGIDPEIYTVIEPNAYFICSCLPGIRPLVREMYMRSGLGSVISKIYQSSSSASKGLRLGDYNIPLGNPRGSHSTSISASKGSRYRSWGEDYSGFVRLDETVQADYFTNSTGRFATRGSFQV